MQYIIEHTRLGFCWWDLLALVVLIITIVYWVYKNKKFKEAKKDLEYELTALNADESVASAAETVANAASAAVESTATV